MEGSTGTGKTNCLEMLSTLMNHDASIVFDPLEELHAALQKAAADGIVRDGSRLLVPGKMIPWDDLTSFTSAVSSSRCVFVCALPVSMYRMPLFVR
jgi:hypothetical protein